MSLPPTVIRVKRKADSEESPVTFLQIDTGNKRHRSDSDWIYRRRIAAARPTASVTPPPLERPVIHSSVPVSQSEVPASSTKPPALQNGSAGPTGIKQQPAVALELDINKSTKSALADRSAKRRFHLVYADQSTTLKHGGISKKQRYQAATFMERSKAASDEESETSSYEAVTADALDSSKDTPPPPVERPQKKPGARSKITPRPLPPSMVNPFEDPATLIPKMDAWTLDMISKNVAEIEARNAPPKPATTKLGIRPKPPAKRFAEREPELAKKLEEQYSTARRDEKKRATEDTVMTDLSDNEEGSWVVDEYERVPAHRWVAELEDPTAIGVLVIDTEEAMQEFYAANDESDTDYGSDDEDENAENHYTADYPEDEVDSDDEYDRDPYAFRNNNASDDEEFDTTAFDDDIYASDEDNEVDDLKAQFRRHLRGLGR